MRGAWRGARPRDRQAWLPLADRADREQPGKGDGVAGQHVREVVDSEIEAAEADRGHEDSSARHARGAGAP
jgi:hypothetical protein